MLKRLFFAVTFVVSVAPLISQAESLHATRIRLDAAPAKAPNVRPATR